MSNDVHKRQIAVKMASIYDTNKVYTMEGSTAVTDGVLTEMAELFAEVPDADRYETYTLFMQEMTSRGITPDRMQFNF